MLIPKKRELPTDHSSAVSTIQYISAIREVEAANMP
jgi:hypothetical protein